MHLYRLAGSSRTLYLEAVMAEFITSERATVKLEPEDVLRVETAVDHSFPFQETIQTISSLAGLVLLMISLAAYCGALASSLTQ